MIASAVTSVGWAGLAWLSGTPSPQPSPSLKPGLQPTDVSPGFLGFAVTFVLVLATVLLLMDMVRRIRRIRLRAEQDQVGKEQVGRDRAGHDPAAREQQDQPAPGEGPAPG